MGMGWDERGTTTNNTMTHMTESPRLQHSTGAPTRQLYSTVWYGIAVRQLGDTGTATDATAILPHLIVLRLAQYYTYSTVLSPQSTVHSPQSTFHSPQSTVHSPQSTVHSPQSTVLSPQSTVPSPQSSFLIPHSSFPTAPRPCSWPCRGSCMRGTSPAGPLPPWRLCGSRTGRCARRG